MDADPALLTTYQQRTYFSQIPPECFHIHNARITSTAERNADQPIIIQTNEPYDGDVQFETIADTGEFCRCS